MRDIPGFNAERAAHATRSRYGGRGQNASLHSSIQPALPKVCDLLSELVWGAYNEGAYNRAEFWERLMDRAGCFN